MTTATATSATSSTQESAVSSPSRGRGSVQLDRLVRCYGNVLAVNDVSLNVAPGEFVTLLGPSGSGKTTTLMMIAGFEIPDAGSIWIDGSDITRLPPHRRNLGVIFQNYALFPHMTVEENVAYPLRMQRRPKAEITQRVQQSLALVQLDGLGQRLPSQLSGGQQQRVAIARALVFDPPVLLLDEPLGALDKKLRQHLQGELKALHQQSGKTMIYVTHDQEEALSMSDRVAVMKDGVIRQVGTPKEIYQRPADLFVATFVGEINLLPIQPNTGGGRPSALTCSGVLIPLPADSSPALEDDGVVCIRPEKLSVEQTPGPGEARNARIPGTIQSTTFVGDATYLRFQGDGNEQLLIKQLNQGSESPYTAGARAVATWEPDDAIVFSNGSLEEDFEDGIR